MGELLSPIFDGNGPWTFTTLTDFRNLRQGFYINLPIAAPFVPVMLFFLPNFDRNKDLTFLQKAKTVDWLGTVLSCGAFASGTMALSFGGVLFPWGDRRIIAMFVLSAVLFTIFFITQSRTVWTTTENRIFPMEFFKNRTLVLLGILVGTSHFNPLCFLTLLEDPNQCEQLWAVEKSSLQSFIFRPCSNSSTKTLRSRRRFGCCRWFASASDSS